MDGCMNAASARALARASAVCGLAFVAACAGADPGTIRAVSGNYNVSISTMGKTDPDVLTVAQGMGSFLVFTFTAGITTDAMGPNPSGLRVGYDGVTLSVASQPVRVDHSTGAIDGTVTGSGTLIRSGSVGLTLHLSPTNFAVPTSDGGSAPADGGASATLDYEITGTHE
jgi:hypothetical protein